MLQAIERYMKQAIVDKVSSVSSSALVSSLVSERVASCLARAGAKQYHCDSLTRETFEKHICVSITLSKSVLSEQHYNIGS